MTVYLVLVSSIYGGIATIKLFQARTDALAYKEKAKGEYPYHDGWTVALYAKTVSPAKSTVSQA